MTFNPFNIYHMRDVAALEATLSQDPGMVYLRGDRRVTPLHVAAQANTPDAIRLLLAAGADIEAQDKLQRTPLAHAVLSNATECALALIKAGAKLNGGRHLGFGFTPFTPNRCAPTLRAIIEYRTGTGSPPEAAEIMEHLRVATSQNQDKVVAVYAVHATQQAKEEAAAMAAGLGNHAALVALKAFGVDMVDTVHEGRTLLEHALKCDHDTSKVVDFLRAEQRRRYLDIAPAGDSAAWPTL